MNRRTYLYLGIIIFSFLIYNLGTTIRSRNKTHGLSEIYKYNTNDFLNMISESDYDSIYDKYVRDASIKRDEFTSQIDSVVSKLGNIDHYHYEYYTSSKCRDKIIALNLYYKIKSGLNKDAKAIFQINIVSQNSHSENNISRVLITTPNDLNMYIFVNNKDI